MTGVAAMHPQAIRGEFVLRPAPYALQLGMGHLMDHLRAQAWRPLRARRAAFVAASGLHLGSFDGLVRSRRRSRVRAAA